MADLPKFSEDNAVCQKCGFCNVSGMAECPVHGASAIATRFVVRPETTEIRQQNFFDQLTGRQQEDMSKHWDNAGVKPGQEALIRICTRCGYSWAEACLDDPDLALRLMEN